MIVGEAAEPLVIDLVEYDPLAAVDRVAVKRDQLYLGVRERKGDGITCLGIRNRGAERGHNIEVGLVLALTVRGQRHVLATPPGRYRIRSQEIVRIVEGQFSEDWAAPYFDPSSPKFWGREPEPEPERADPAELPLDQIYVLPRPAQGGRLRWLVAPAGIAASAAAIWFAASGPISRAVAFAHARPTVARLAYLPPHRVHHGRRHAHRRHHHHRR